MKTLTFDFIEDPGHGWLKVPLPHLLRLNILSKISECSYMRKGFAYLEEDCDASVLINALKEKGVEVKFRTKVCRQKSSKVRSYARFNAAEAFV